jgi:hypothetical protein
VSYETIKFVGWTVREKNGIDHSACITAEEGGFSRPLIGNKYVGFSP